jgi:small subunit ribosomal protein S1
MTSQEQPPGVPLPAWTDFVARHAGGGVLNGRVTKVLPFGAFVEVAEGIQGLLPKSAWTTQPAAGASIPVRIAGIDVERRRVSLTPA